MFNVYVVCGLFDFSVGIYVTPKVLIILKTPYLKNSAAIIIRIKFATKKVSKLLHVTLNEHYWWVKSDKLNGYQFVTFNPPKIHGIFTDF